MPGARLEGGDVLLRPGNPTLLARRDRAVGVATGALVHFGREPVRRSAGCRCSCSIRLRAHEALATFRHDRRVLPLPSPSAVALSRCTA
jgi:hypothetical protein